MSIGPGKLSHYELLQQRERFKQLTKSDSATDMQAFAVISSITLVAVGVAAAYAIGEATGMSL